MTEQPQPPKEAAFFTNIRQWGLTRGDEGIVGGVVEGAGAKIGLAKAPARLLVVLLWFLLPGLVMLGYAAAWGLLPDRRGNIIIQNFGRGVTNVGALLGIAILTLFGFGAAAEGPLIGTFGWGGGSWMWTDFGSNGVPEAMRLLVILVVIGIPILILAGVIVLIVWLVKRSNSTTAPPPAGAWATPPAGPAGQGAAGTADAPPTDAGAEPAGDGTPPWATTASGAPGGAADNAAHASADSAHAAAPPVAAHRPQPWEPALTPGDPRLAEAFGTVPPPPPYGPGAPTASGVGAPPVPPRPAAPYRQPWLQVPGPGRGGYFGFLGVLFIAAAIVFAVDRMDRLAVNPVLAWGAVVTVGLGIVLVGVALTGRKLGFLGFISVIAVLAGIPLAANADYIREDHARDRAWWNFEAIVEDEEVVEEEPDEMLDPAVDLPEQFVDDYSQVYLASGCWALSETDDPNWISDPRQWAGAGQARIRLDEVTEDTTLTVGDGATIITIPAGSNMVLSRNDPVHVVWEQRDLMCDFWDEGPIEGEWLSFVNPEEPVVEIVPTGHDVAIFIKEEQS